LQNKFDSLYQIYQNDQPGTKTRQIIDFKRNKHVTYKKEFYPKYSTQAVVM